MPVGRCVRRTAVATFFTFWPPGPLAWKMSIFSSSSRMSTSTSSAAGRTATGGGGGEGPALFPAGAGPDLDDHVLPIAGVSGQESALELLLELVATGHLRLQFLASQGHHGRVVALIKERARLGREAVSLRIPAVERDHLLQRGAFAGQGLELLVVGGHLRA